MSAEAETVQEVPLDAPNVATDSAIAEFSTYEDYLDSQITQQDLFYLEVIQ